MIDSTPPMPDNRIAFIIDNKVVEIIYAHDRLAAALLSDPVIIDIADVKADDNSNVHVDYLYNPTTKAFTPPAVGA
jgi:hypothetical protein